MQPYEEHVVEPRETLEVEYKGWLDLDDGGHRAALAVAMLALANHGGGVVLLGFVKDDAGHLAPDAEGAPDRPRELYSSDAMNGIVDRYADPPFHVEVRFVEHPASGREHPILVVPGGHTAPIMAKRDGPDGDHINQMMVYIRRPGPQSARPRSAAEWRTLFDRCLRNGAAGLQSLLSGVIGPSPDDALGDNQPDAGAPEPEPGNSEPDAKPPSEGEPVDGSDGHARDEAARDDGRPRGSPSIEERLSERPAAPPPPDENAVLVATDALRPEDRFVLQSPVSEARVRELRDGIDETRASFPMRRLFSAADAYRREHRFDPRLRFGMSTYLFKGPFVDGSNWGKIQPHELAISFEHWLLKRFLELIEYRAKPDTTVRSAGELLEFVQRAKRSLEETGARPDLIVLQGQMADGIHADMLGMFDWRSPPMIRGVDVSGTSFVDYPLAELPVLCYFEKDMAPIVSVVDLTDYEYIQTDWLNDASGDTRVEVDPIDADQAEQILLEHPDLHSQLYQAEHSQQPGLYGSEEAIVHMQLRVKILVESAGTVQERYTPRTVSAPVAPATPEPRS